MGLESSDFIRRNKFFFLRSPTKPVSRSINISRIENFENYLKFEFPIFEFISFFILSGRCANAWDVCLMSDCWTDPLKSPISSVRPTLADGWKKLNMDSLTAWKGERGRRRRKNINMEIVRSRYKSEYFKLYYAFLFFSSSCGRGKGGTWRSHKGSEKTSVS